MHTKTMRWLPKITGQAGIVYGLSAVVATSAFALTDNQQLLSGGTSLAPFATIYNAPGLGNSYGIDFPGIGLGKEAAAIRMPAGTLSNLRVKAVTQNPPVDGRLTVTVLKNGTATALTCHVTGTGACTTNIGVNFAANDKLAVEAKTTLEEAGFMTYTYTLQFD